MILADVLQKRHSHVRLGGLCEQLVDGHAGREVDSLVHPTTSRQSPKLRRVARGSLVSEEDEVRVGTSVIERMS